MGLSKQSRFIRKISLYETYAAPANKRCRFVSDGLQLPRCTVCRQHTGVHLTLSLDIEAYLCNVMQAIGKCSARIMKFQLFEAFVTRFGQSQCHMSVVRPPGAPGAASHRPRRCARPCAYHSHLQAFGQCRCCLCCVFRASLAHSPGELR